jgi:hypothetical protein
MFKIVVQFKLISVKHLTTFIIVHDAAFLGLFVDGEDALFFVF